MWEETSAELHETVVSLSVRVMTEEWDPVGMGDKRGWHVLFTVFLGGGSPSLLTSEWPSVGTRRHKTMGKITCSSPDSKGPGMFPVLIQLQFVSVIKEN